MNVRDAIISLYEGKTIKDEKGCCYNILVVSGESSTERFLRVFRPEKVGKAKISNGLEGLSLTVNYELVDP